jgi:CubicO group peptidase (beta-lactamase class C family)
MKTNLTLLLILIGSFCWGQKSSITKQKVDSVIVIHSPKKSFSGIIGFWQKDKGIQLFNYGYKDFETKEPIANDDRFYLASIAKSFTSFAILQLIKEGKLSPNDTIGKWFPQFSPSLRKVTIKQLANHTAAIHDYLALTSKREDLTNKEVIEIIKPIDSTVYPSGLKWGYSNTHFVLLAEIVEKVSGKDFISYSKENIFKPMKMDDAVFFVEGAKSIQGYDVDTTPLYKKTKTLGDGGLLGSANDMVAFFKTITNDQKWKELLLLGLENGYIWDRDTSWTSGMGVFFTEDNFDKFTANSGRGSGFLNYYRWYYEKDAAFFILSNKWDPFVQAMRNDLANLLKE